MELRYEGSHLQANLSSRQACALAFQSVITNRLCAGRPLWFSVVDAVEDPKQRCGCINLLLIDSSTAQNHIHFHWTRPLENTLSGRPPTAADDPGKLPTLTCTILASQLLSVGFKWKATEFLYALVKGGHLWRRPAGQRPNHQRRPPTH